MAAKQLDTPAPRALALQIECQAINRLKDRKDVDARIAQSIGRIDAAIAGTIGFHGSLDLVVLPEYILTGHPAGDSLQGWRERAAIRQGGEELARLGEVAAAHGVYLAINAYEAEDCFPDLYFQTSFILSPTGTIVLTYRRLISMYTPSPYDVLERYIDAYGEDALFPVADTPIGRLAMIASEEILYPEIARCFAARGAEVFLHPTSEAALKGLSPKNLAKRARAMENMAYVVSANSASIEGGVMLADSTSGSSQIVDFEGRVLIEAENGESMNVVHEIDIGALRRNRRRVGMSNYVARQPLALYAAAYAQAVSPHVADNFSAQTANGQSIERAFFKERQQAAIDRLAQKGII